MQSFKLPQHDLRLLKRMSISNNCDQMASEIISILLLQKLLTYVCLLVHQKKNVCLLVLVRMITNPQ